jgi:NADH dehydrogenase
MSALKADAERGSSHYLRSKGQADAAIAGSGLAYTIFRPSVIFGPDDSFINRFALLLRRLPVVPLPRADARFAPVFVEDVADAFAAALADLRTASTTYELCGPDIYSLEELVRFVRGVLGVRRLIVPLPDSLGRVQAWIGEYLLPGKPLSIDNFASLGVASVCSADGLERLGIAPRALSTVVPAYLGAAGAHRQLARLRQSARRR